MISLLKLFLFCILMNRATTAQLMTGNSLSCTKKVMDQHPSTPLKQGGGSWDS